MTYTVDDINYLTDLCAKLDAAPKKDGARGRMVESAMSFRGWSRNKLYKGLVYVRGESNRKQRTDKGDCEIPDKELELVAGIMMHSMRDTGKQLLCIEDALEIATESHQISVKRHHGTWLRVMKQRGMHPSQLQKDSPSQEMASNHPNHVWQIDVSTCVLFYLSTGGLDVMPKSQFYANKMENFYKIKDERVQRYLLTDHTSGAFYIEYFLRPGEDAQTASEFLFNGMTKRSHPQDPFHGVPFMLVSDQGSFLKNKLMKNLFKNLGIKTWMHKRKNSRAKGQVESTHNICERKFEGRLKFMNPPVQNLEQLNQFAWAWSRSFQGTKKHSRHGNPRFVHWTSYIRSHQIRLCPSREVWNSLLNTEPVTRVIGGNLRISFAMKNFGSNEYAVDHVPNVRVGEKIEVVVNPYEAPKLYVIRKDEEGRDQFYSCEPLEKNEHGFSPRSVVFGEGFKSIADTASDTMRKELEMQALDATTEEELSKARKERRPAYKGKLDPMSYLDRNHTTDYIVKKGEALDVDAPLFVNAKKLSLYEVTRALIASHGFESITPDQNRLISKWYPAGEVPEDDLSGLAKRLNDVPQLQVVGEN